MELRLADEDTKETQGGLKLSGENELQSTQRENEPKKNPWDYDGMNETLELRSFSQPIYTTEPMMQSEKDENVGIKVGTLVVPLCMIIQMAIMVWVCTQSKADAYMNLMKFQGVFGLTQIILIVDAILVNVLYKKKISLIFVAWMFNFLYPIQRSKHVGTGETIGKLCSFGIIIGTIATIAAIYEGITSYGGILQITDEAVRKEAIVVMDQLDESGQRIGDKIMKEVYVSDAHVETQGGMTAVALAGEGSIKMDGDTFVDTGVSNIETYLGFVKTDNGNYEIQMVVLGDTQLTSYGAKAYWNAVIQN